MMRCLVQVSEDGNSVYFWPEEWLIVPGGVWTLTGEDAERAKAHIGLSAGETCISMAARKGPRIRISRYKEPYVRKGTVQ